MIAGEGTLYKSTQTSSLGTDLSADHGGKGEASVNDFHGSAVMM